MRQLRRRLILGLAFGFVVLLVLALIGDLREVSLRLSTFTWWFAPLILLCTLFNYVLRFIKWHYYLAQIGVRDLSRRESARIFVSGFPLAITPGKVGEALKAVWLNRATGVSTARGVTVVLAERISDGLAVLILSTLGVIAYPLYWPAFAAVLGTLLAIVILSQIRPLALSLLQLAARLPIVNRLAHHLGEFYEGTYALFRPRAAFTAIGLGTLAWLGEGVGMYLVLLGLNIPSGWETFSLAVFVLSFSTVIGAISALPGGLGAAEISIAGMLGWLMTMPASTAASATLLIRLGTLWFGIALGLLVWTRSPDLLTMEVSDSQKPSTDYQGRSQNAVDHS
jgi:uncharacterized protein (TIRG00374 family)